jgi:hypothetical protein
MFTAPARGLKPFGSEKDRLGHSRPRRSGAREFLLPDLAEACSRGVQDIGGKASATDIPELRRFPIPRHCASAVAEKGERAVPSIVIPVKGVGPIQEFRFINVGCDSVGRGWRRSITPGYVVPTITDKMASNTRIAKVNSCRGSGGDGVRQADRCGLQRTRLSASFRKSPLNWCRSSYIRS